MKTLLRLLFPTKKSRTYSNPNIRPSCVVFLGKGNWILFYVFLLILENMYLSVADLQNLFTRPHLLEIVENSYFDSNFTRTIHTWHHWFSLSRILHVLKEIKCSNHSKFTIIEDQNIIRKRWSFWERILNLMEMLM